MVTKADIILTAKQTCGPMDRLTFSCVKADEGGLANRQWTERGMDASTFRFKSDFNSAMRCFNNRTLSVYPILVPVKSSQFRSF
jgi:hypothetical protein